MSDALDRHAWNGHQGMHAVTADIGMLMPDIAARQHGHRTQDACIRHCFKGFIAVDRFWGLWQPLGNLPLWDLNVV